MEEIKVVLIGGSAVGKTSLFQRMEGRGFSRDQPSTSSACFEVKTEKGPVKLIMRDTAGHESYRAIIPIFFRNASVVIIVFDVTKRNTFDSINEWFEFVRENAPENTKIVLVGNKTDLRESVKDSVQVSEIVRKGDEIGAIFSTETSALSGNGIDLLKETVALHAFEKYEEVTKAVEPEVVDVSSTTDTKEPDKKNCC